MCPKVFKKLAPIFPTLALLQYVTNVIDELPCGYASIDNETLLGCIDVEADNYDAQANVDDGSCEYLGCTNLEADNYDAQANVDDGSCDSDGDGVPDNEEILGCTYENDPNYNELATEDDGSCEPSVGMYAFGGVIYRISGSTAYIVNIHDEQFTSRTLSNCSAIVNALTTNGYDDWEIPSEIELDYICPQKSFIDFIASNYDGTVMFGSNDPYVSSQTFCNTGNNGAGPYCIPYYFQPTSCCPPAGDCMLGGYSGNCCCQEADFYLRSVRTETF